MAKIIERERPQALLPTLGGQTGLNTAMQLAETGVLDSYGVEMIGANQEAIRKAEDRELFKKAMRTHRPGSAAKRLRPQPGGGPARSSRRSGFRRSSGRASPWAGPAGASPTTWRSSSRSLAQGIELSMIHEVLIEESVIGWKEYELEVMRDLKDNVVIICSIENFDPMGVHTGDTITVAPAQTLTDKEYQRMRDAAIAIIREIGVETGGSNIQFAVNPRDGRMVVIEMNPRVSRSSALASKATGFPIAKMAAKLAVGYTLDEIPNDITRETMASFEPTIDYCVVKIPRLTFEKFPGADPTLTTSMKSVGEAMAIGRTFKEALQKGASGPWRSDASAWAMEGQRRRRGVLRWIREKLRTPTAERIFYLRTALKNGISVEEIAELTQIDPWFLENMKQICDLEEEIRPFGKNGRGLESIPGELLRQAKEYGYFRCPAGPLLGSDEMHPFGSGERLGDPTRLQAGGHLRRRIRGLHPLLLFHL